MDSNLTSTPLSAGVAAQPGNPAIVRRSARRR